MNDILGTIKVGIDIGFAAKHTKYIWHACEHCGKQRWVELRKEMPRNLKCHSCGQRGNKKKWDGGYHHNSKGYMLVWLAKDDFFYSMADSESYVLEHRLVMAKHLGRYLHSWELVHHRNHIRDDNRIENLQLVSDHRHKQITILENRIKQLEGRVTLLEADNALLRDKAKRIVE